MASRLLLDDALLVDPGSEGPGPGRLLLEAGRVAARVPPGAPAPGDAARVSLRGLALSPGMIDLHHHGELVVGRADDAAEALRRESASLASHGVTAWLPTTVSWPAPELGDRIGAIASAIEGGAWPGAEPLGLHLEGPWIRVDAAGAQPLTGIHPYDSGSGRALLELARGLVRMVTLAPEIEGAGLLVDELVRRGCVVALGHTLADAAQVDAAARRGARHVTHLFNAMGPLHHRGPGVAGAVLADDRLSCDVIADGVHVEADWLRIAARAKGERLLLITDRVELPGSATEGAAFGTRIASDGHAWRLPDGRLAASRLHLHDAVGWCARERVMTRHDAIAACTLRPARLLGLERERGTLRPGARADLVLWSDAGTVLATWVAGRLVHRAPDAPDLDAR